MKEILKIPNNSCNIYYVNSNINKNYIHIDVLVKAGTNMESKNLSGISHLLEHIILDSWEKCSGKSCIYYWLNKCVKFNAFTAGYYVSYNMSSVLKYYKEIINFMIEIIFNPKINENIMNDAKKAVKEELLNYINNPYIKFKNFIQKTIYSSEQIGKYNKIDYKLQYDLLDSITIDNLYDYHKKFYLNKDNIIFLIISNKENYQQISSYFNSYYHSLCKNTPLSLSPINTIKQKETTPLINQNDKSIYYFHSPSFTKTLFCIVFKTNIYNGSSPDTVYFPIINEFLCADLTSYLYFHMRVKNKLIYDISIDFDVDSDEMELSFNFSTKNENAKKVLFLFIKLIKNLLEKNINEEYFNLSKEKLTLKFGEICHNPTFFSSYYSNKLIYDIKDITSPEKNHEILIKCTKEKFLEIITNIFNFKNMFIFYQSNKSFNN